MTHLPSIPKLRCHCSRNSLVHIGTVEDNEWGEAAQLHGDTFHRICCMVQQDLQGVQRENTVSIQINLQGVTVCLESTFLPDGLGV